MVSKKNIYKFVILVCLGVCFITVIVMSIQGLKLNNINDVLVTSENDRIHIEWNKTIFCGVNNVEVGVKRCGKDEYGRYYMPSYYYLDACDEKFDFVEGVHGAKYKIIIYAINKDGTKSELIDTEKQFLDYDQMPKLPIISVNTKNGIEPTCYRDNSKGYVERTNDDISSFIKYNSGTRIIQKRAKICVRGNSSSELPQKPYTLKFFESINLIEDCNASHKRWTLLALDGEVLNAYIGFSLSDICNMEYTPKMQFVNLIINGDWRGMYLLCEDESGLIQAGKVGETGFIVERDPYYLDGENYIKTENIPDNLAFSIKYPESVSDEKYYAMRNYLNEIEQYIITNDNSLQEYIDYDSFVKWLIIRDIMGHGDGWGSNAFYYIEEFDEKSVLNDNRLKMGPLWDFDSAFLVYNQFSVQHYLNECWFPYLMLSPSFKDTYKAYWENNSDRIYANINRRLDRLYEEHGEDLEMSYYLTCEKYKKMEDKYENSFFNEIIRYKTLMLNQRRWIDTEIRETNACIE